ncbi:MAG TPA: hypothetical protein VMW72_11125 [Sedimentisphaerales bacterium]|nr:hypothetical protein [Sedimentisphaerales bacterium]
MCRYTVLVAVCLVSLQALAAEEHLSVSELIDKYASTQDKLYSFITKSKETMVHTSERTGITIWKTVAEFRFDGDRVDYRSYRWHNLASEDEATNNLEEAQYRSFVWDGSRHIQYRTGETVDDNYAAIHRQTGPYRKRRAVAIEYGGAPLLGIFYSDEDRADSVLRKADSISVRDELERVGGVPCYVIDAKTKWGTYTVWIDPEHGYNITKADVQRKKGDLIWRNRTMTDKSLSFSLKNVRFEKIDDAWVPMEADIGIIMEGPTYIQDIKVKHQRTEVILNPDHDTLGSFIPDIENGTKVYIEGAPGITYIWQDGKPVTQVDEYVIDEIDKMTEELMAEGQVPVGLATDKKTEAAPNKPPGIVETQATAEEAKGEILSESRPLPVVVLILIGLLIIGVIAWRMFLLKKE